MTSALLTSSEKKSIDNLLQQRKDDHKFIFKLNEINDSSKKKIEERIIVLSTLRVYFFKSGGKALEDYHIYELLEINSPSPTELTLRFQPAPEKKPKYITQDPSQCDQIIRHIYQCFVTFFPGLSIDEAPRFTISPDSRLEQIMSSLVGNLGVVGASGGFSLSYKAICDALGVSPLLFVCYDMDQILPRNKITEFNWNEIYGFTPPDVKPLLKTLQVNSCFNSLIIEHTKMPADTLGLVADILSHNPNIQKCVAASIAAPKEGFEKLAVSLLERRGPNLLHLDLSGNPLTNKAAMSLANAFQAGPSLTVLNLQGCGAREDGMESLLSLMSQNPNFTGQLKVLQIGGNRLDTAGTTALSTFLQRSQALVELGISNTNPVYSVLKSGCASLLTVDLSGNKAVGNKEKEGSAALFLSQCPSLTSLNLSRAQLSADDVKVLSQSKGSFNKVAVLDLSDNELGDEGLQAIFESIYFNSRLRSLSVGGNFKASKAKTRIKVMDLLISLVEDLSHLDTLSIAVSTNQANAQLKGDIVPFLISLMTNKSLTSLNIEGNGMGDLGALALGKMLQRNSTLKSLKWDENAITERGLKLFKLGLERGMGSLISAPLPIKDIFTFLKPDSPATQAKIKKTCADIQKVLFSNASRSRSNTSTEVSMPNLGLEKPPSIGNLPSKATPKSPMIPVPLLRATNNNADSPSPTAPPRFVSGTTPHSRFQQKQVSASNLTQLGNNQLGTPTPTISHQVSIPAPLPIPSLTVPPPLPIYSNQANLAAAAAAVVSGGAPSKSFRKLGASANVITNSNTQLSASQSTERPPLNNAHSLSNLKSAPQKPQSNPQFSAEKPTVVLPSPTSTPVPSQNTNHSPSHTPQIQTPPPSIPPLINVCINFLSTKGIKSHGIFRICASASDLKKLKARFERGENVDLFAEFADPDTVAGLLKGYFREIPEPLIDEKYHAKFTLAAPLANVKEKVLKLKEAWGELSVTNQYIANILLGLLFKISSHSDVNAMSPDNLAICWSPTLFRSFDTIFIELLANIITNYEYIFQNKAFPSPSSEKPAQSPPREHPQTTNADESDDSDDDEDDNTKLSTTPTGTNILTSVESKNGINGNGSSSSSENSNGTSNRTTEDIKDLPLPPPPLEPEESILSHNDLPTYLPPPSDLPVPLPEASPPSPKRPERSRIGGGIMIGSLKPQLEVLTTRPILDVAPSPTLNREDSASGSGSDSSTNLGGERKSGSRVALTRQFSRAPSRTYRASMVGGRGDLLDSRYATLVLTNDTLSAMDNE